MSTMEQAPAPRIPLHLDVEFKRSYARAADAGKLLNISMTGAFLEHTSSELKKNDKVALVFKVSGRIRKIVANVVWANEEGCGVQFQPFNNRDVQIVDDLMYFVENSRDSRRTVLDDIFKQVS